jgi:hypothetical protein
MVRFSKESAGLLDLHAELKIWPKDRRNPSSESFGTVDRRLGRGLVEPSA